MKCWEIANNNLFQYQIWKIPWFFLFANFLSILIWFSINLNPPAKSYFDSYNYVWHYNYFVVSFYKLYCYISFLSYNRHCYQDKHYLWLDSLQLLDHSWCGVTRNDAAELMIQSLSLFSAICALFGWKKKELMFLHWIHLMNLFIFCLLLWCYAIKSKMMLLAYLRSSWIGSSTRAACYVLWSIVSFLDILLP